MKLKYKNLFLNKRFKKNPTLEYIDTMGRLVKGLIKGVIVGFMPTIRGAIKGFELSDRVYSNQRRTKNKKIEIGILGGCILLTGSLGLAFNVIAAPILIPASIVSGIKTAVKDE